MAKKNTPKIIKLRIQDATFDFLLPVKKGVAAIKVGDTIKDNKGKVFLIEGISKCGAGEAGEGFNIKTVK